MPKSRREPFATAATALALFTLFGARIAFGQTAQSSGDIITKIGTYIVDPLLVVIFAAGFFMFMWGLMQFMISANRGEDTSDGKRHMIYGTIGMFIMVSVYGIISLLDSTFGLNVSNPSLNNNINVPTMNLTGQ